MKLRLVYFLLFLLSNFIVYPGFAQSNKPFLSNLSATKDSPLYTTYAAAMERSEFTLDEGFHFMFYDPEQGIDFTTDTGGDWCLAFKRGANYVYELKNMFKQPLITASYPDMVKYEYYPFEDVKVNVTFLVYSSRIAIQDITLTNTGPAATEFKIYPFLKNDYRVFNDVEFSKDKSAVTFTHEELPDGWTLGHNMPYVDKVYDVFLFSEAPDRMTTFRGYKWGNFSIPHQVDLHKEKVYIVWGKMSHENDKRCRHHNPKPRIIVMLNNDRSKLLTESAPRWGSADPNITSYGYYGIELGNFEGLKKGDDYTIRLICPETGQTGVINDKVDGLPTENSQRRDITFTESDLPPAPDNLRKDVWGSGTEIRLYWDKAEGMRYNIYRRDYRKNAVYDLIAENIERSFYTDKNISGDKIYGYIITAVDGQNRMSMPTEELSNIFGSDFITDMKYPDQRKTYVKDLARVIAAQKLIKLDKGQSKNIRIIRGFAKDENDLQKISEQAKSLMNENLDEYLTANEKLFSKIPPLQMDDPDLQMLYYSAFNLMRQVMLPPEEKSSYNYYVFSREPTWGWGHGGQVFHESLTMFAYALMDPVSAMNSQRVYSERQYENGYINYRTGSFLDEIIEHDGDLTSSAPWYAWQNWEVYKITKDKDFLKEMYESSKRFYNFYVSNRDQDNDGLCEWGGHGVLECVRDGLVAVWNEVGWPANFEAVDLNCMLVKETNALADMAEELGYKDESQTWRQKAKTRAELVNKTFWDEETGFYYQVDKKDHDFTFKNENDLKRQEIIGFLPMWAGIASKERAAILMKTLTDTSKFWRKYGVPSLAADDSYYNPKGYWNGPVWVEWDYFIMDALIQYGYKDEAKELVKRVAANMVAQLKKDHNLWEFYSPDEQWAGYHKTYIWAGIINRMLIDVAEF
jgi:hypothetical protein